MNIFRYKLFIEEGTEEVGCFQDLLFSNNEVKLEKGLMYLNLTEKMQDRSSISFRIKGPINVGKLRVDTLSVGSLEGRMIVINSMEGVADLVSNQEIEEAINYEW